MDERLKALKQGNRLADKAEALIAIVKNINAIVEASPADLQDQVALQLNAAELLMRDGDELVKRCDMLTDALVRVQGITRPRSHRFHAGPYTGYTVYDYQLIAREALERAK